MPEVFLDSSVLIGLVFRHAGERAACRASFPADPILVCSRYVLFEVARGFLRSLITLHNLSFEFRSYADLHLAAYSGQRRFRPYQMNTWLGAFTDFQAALEAQDGPSDERQKLEEFRAKLRGWIRRGWRQMHRQGPLINSIGCRDDLRAPALRADERLDQRLPDDECGNPAACTLQRFITDRRPEIDGITIGLEQLPANQRDQETVRRIAALRHLLGMRTGEPFDGKQCHRCGDALICLESPPAHVIATKNRKHFEPLAALLGKAIVIAETAQTTAG